jgi:hypothetical protein
MHYFLRHPGVNVLGHLFFGAFVIIQFGTFLQQCERASHCSISSIFTLSPSVSVCILQSMKKHFSARCWWLIPTYSTGRRWEDCSSRPDLAKSLRDPISTEKAGCGDLYLSSQLCWKSNIKRPWSRLC